MNYVLSYTTQNIYNTPVQKIWPKIGIGNTNWKEQKFNKDAKMHTHSGAATIKLKMEWLSEMWNGCEMVKVVKKKEYFFVFWEYLLQLAFAVRVRRILIIENERIIQN